MPRSRRRWAGRAGFSALQRAENSSIRFRFAQRSTIYSCFSALQRAENSSIEHSSQTVEVRAATFQCSSASRKFLNSRANERRIPSRSVSVLFSEPKIPQCIAVLLARAGARVSVLFSEPKIPQLRGDWNAAWEAIKFQCSSASRKFLNSPAL